MSDGTSGQMSRRKFISIGAVSFSLAGISGFLWRQFSTGPAFTGSELRDEFHFFDDNLTNLHFYFVNAKLEDQWVRCDPTRDSFMVVKIPQQHISEQLLREKEFTNGIPRKPGVPGKDFLKENANTLSEISGFSYLAFKLHPKADIYGQPSIALNGMETLLDWNNRENFTLVIPKKNDYRRFPADTKPYPDKADGFLNFRKRNTAGVAENDNPLSFLEQTCKQLFYQSSFVPITLLEIPKGLLLTPYVPPGTHDGDGGNRETRVIFQGSGIKKQRFVFSTLTGNVARSVEEVWNSRMWFQQFEKLDTGSTAPTYRAFGERFNPSLRPAGYVIGTCKDSYGETVPCPERDVSGKCVDLPITYLPTFLDQQEITYIANLGREKADNEGAEWNLEAKGLIFTGLGTVAKFHYKNLNPPRGTSLAEYEHHITLGRDEFIKVARLGVITNSGQRSLHVKIGRRKIVQGHSYMEFKEYIDVVQKEIEYFDSNLFIEKVPVDEPANYIHARKDPTTGATEHTSQPNVAYWQDSIIWKTPATYTDPSGTPSIEPKALPEEWETHYRRWPFKKITSITSVTSPLNTDRSSVPPGTIIDSNSTVCGSCSDGPMAFWPVLEADVTKNAELEFAGVDWDDKPIKFTSTFLFIRKEIIDSIDASKPCVEEIYMNFFSSPPERRHIQFVDSDITFTRNFATQEPDGKSEFANKSNKAKTDFVEYYFGLCSETVSGSIDGSIFNERYFPLFPQIKRAKLFVENLQSYSERPLPSVIEYNSDYIEYGFDGRGNGATSGPIYNKARLVFDHTQKFLEGRERFLELTGGGVWREPVVAEAYNSIRQTFSSAGDSIGGLVNPDFDVQSIGLVKQSIAVARDINKKYENLADFDTKLKKFNPSDLLRQTPEIFNGISLLSILSDEIPALETPVNQIKNLAAELDKLPGAILNSEFYKDLMSGAADINALAKGLLEKIDLAQKEVEELQAETQAMKDLLNVDNFFGEVKRLVDGKLSQVRISYLKHEDGIIKVVAKDIDEVIDAVTYDLLSNLEILWPYYEKVKSAGDRLDQLKTTTLKNGKSFSADAVKLIEEYKARYITLLFELGPVKKLRQLSDIKQSISLVLNDGYSALSELPKATADQAASRLAYLQDSSPANLTDYEAKSTILNSVVRRVELATQSAASLPELLQDGITNQDDIEIFRSLRNDFKDVQNSVAEIFEILRDKTSLTRIVEGYKKAQEEYFIIVAKLQVAKNDATKLFDAIKDATGDGSVSAQNISKAQKKLHDFYANNHDKFRGDYAGLIREGKKFGETLRYLSEEFIWNGLDPAVEEQKAIMVSLSIPTNTKYVKGAFPVGSQLLLPQLDSKRVDVANKTSELNAKISEVQNLARDYEDLAKTQVEDLANGVVGRIRAKLDELRARLETDPTNQAIIKKVEDGRQLYNLLTSLTRKEINYDWHTTSLRSADFGIVSFIASDSPKTSLDVTVRNTIHFQPGQFPPAISRIESIAENRLQNFGIGLLKALIVNFNEVSFVAGTDRSPKFDCKIRDVQFAGAFAFVQALQECFKDLLGDNFSLDIGPSGVEIGYSIPIPFLGAPSFGFRDILFRIAYNLYFDGRPMELGVGIGTRENKTKLSVGIYTGLFYFFVQGNPKDGLTTIEVNLEFGGYFGLSLGPLRGEVKLVVGLYYRKDPLGVTIEGYFLCEGQCKLWFVMIAARFYMGVLSRGNYVEGRCTVSYEVKLGAFFKLSFTATFYKKLAGASSGPGLSSGARKKSSAPLLSSSPKRSLPSATIVSPEIPTEQNPVKRSTRSMTLNEWDTFLNSYFD